MRREASGYSDTDGYTLDEVQAGGMRCTSLTLRAGETLYLPKGAVHQSAAGSTGSARVTLTLARAGACWKDMMREMVDMLPALAQGQGALGDQSPSQRRGTPDESLAAGLDEALRVAQQQPHGIVLHQPVQLLAKIASRRLTEQDVATLSHFAAMLLSICAMALDAHFGNTPPGMARAIAVAQRANHAAWIPAYTDNIARGYDRMVRDVEEKRDGGMSAAVKLEIARAVYDQLSMAAFEQETVVAFDQAMAAKGQLVAHAVEFPDVGFSVDDLIAGDPEFLMLETGWMMRDFEHKVVSGALLPKLRPLSLVPGVLAADTCANSSVDPVGNVSGQQWFPIHQ